MGLLDWKLIATVIILLGIIAVALSMHPAMSDFVDRVFERFFELTPATSPERNISFILSSDEYVDLNFKGQNINIVLKSDNFSAELSTGKIESSNNVSITGAEVSGYVTGKNIFFEGDFSRIGLEGTTISFDSGHIKANATFESLLIENLELAKLELPMASGTIIFDDSMTSIAYKNVTITSLLASIRFNSQMHTEGIANKLSAENIVIG